METPTPESVAALAAVLKTSRAVQRNATARFLAASRAINGKPGPWRKYLAASATLDWANAAHAAAWKAYSEASDALISAAL